VSPAWERFVAIIEANDVRRLIEAASVRRMDRDVRKVTIEANGLPIGKRHNWLQARKVEAETRHLARMEHAEQGWTEALAVAERDYRLKVSAEIEAAP
jgi:hypothetical protein